MIGDKYEVVTEMTLGFGSHTRNPNCQSFKTYKTGEILTLSDDPEGHWNVWFRDSKGNRGKIESGSARNLENRGVIRKIF